MTERGDGGSTARPSLAELRDAAAHADRRVALYRRRVYLGRGEPVRLAELERISAGAARRLREASALDASPTDGAPR